jgi:release factor glutamine methyltransferase
MSGEEMTLDRWMRAAVSLLPDSATPRIDVRVIAGHVLGLDNASIIARGDRVLTNAEAAALNVLIARRARHEPIAHIVGQREFWSLDIEVEPGVLVPRADSETLIAAAIKRRDRMSAFRILDLGCGSGALLCAVLSEYPEASGIGVDIDEGAVALTNRNLARLRLATRGQAIVGDWSAPVQGRFDIVVSNPPYIAETERGRLSPEVEAFESPRALFGGPDGLDAYRRLAGLLPAVLAEGGLVILEIGFDQAATVGSLLGAAFPQGRVDVEKDLAGRDRALIIDLGQEAR